MRSAVEPRASGAGHAGGASAADDRVKVLLITGPGRSGSTLVANLLGQVEGWFSVGETRYIWDRGIVENRKCGCGELFNECPVWPRVLADSFSDPSTLDVDELVRLRDSGLRTRRLLLNGAESLKRILDTEMAPYLEAVRRLYRSIPRVTGASVIVDSSKFPSHAFMLDSIPWIDLRVLHLVRDPRATAHSWMRKKRIRDNARADEMMNRMNPVKSTLIWDEWNHIIRKHWSRRDGAYALLRYEDFVARPGEALDRILAETGNAGVELPFIEGKTVQVAVHHTVSGNPDRFNRGTIQIREDQAWRESMPLWQKTLVTAMAAPWMRRYRYPVRW